MEIFEKMAGKYLILIKSSRMNDKFESIPVSKSVMMLKNLTEGFFFLS